MKGHLTLPRPANSGKFSKSCKVLAVASKSYLAKRRLKMNDAHPWHCFPSPSPLSLTELLRNLFNEHSLAPGVNATTRGSNVIIQLMYPDTDHMLMPGVRRPCCLKQQMSSAAGR